MRTRYDAPKLKQFGNLAIICAVLVLCVIALATPESRGYELQPFVVGAFLVFVVFGVVKYLRMPYQINLNGNESLRFKSILGEATVLPNEISEISGGYYVQFRTSNRKFEMVNGIDGLHELLSWLRERNPSVRVQGL